MCVSASMPAGSGLLPIVGREREQSGLGELLDQAVDGVGSLVLVGGHAGIGKTTLVRDMARRAAERDMLPLTGYCYDLTVTPPYGPWAQIVRLAAQIDRFPSPPAALLDEDDLKHSPSQEVLFGELTRFLTDAAARHPLVIVLEDLHWSDRESLIFLRRFGHGLARLPILIVVTYRDDELKREHELYELLPVLVREVGAHRINLRPLTESAVQSLLASRYRLHATEEADLAEYLRNRAGGNPFFLGELLRALEEEGRLQPAADATWTIGNLEQLPVPPLVRQVIDGRLRRLGDATRTALEVAAVIGQDVPYSLWHTVANLSDVDLVTAVTNAIDAHLLEDVRDGARFRFSHALVREAIYDGLLLPRRLALHQAVAETLMIGPGNPPETVASHLQAANDPRAIDWFIRAGNRVERVAWLSAAEHYQSALRLMRSHANDLGQRGWLIIRLVRLLRFANPGGTLPYLEEADRYATETNDAALSAYVACCRGEVRYYQGAFDRGIREVEAGVAALHTLTEAERTRLDQLITTGEVVSDAVLVGTYAAGLGHLGASERALRHGLEAESHATARGQRVPAEARWAIGLAQALRGNPEAARRAIAAARDHFWEAHDYNMVGSSAFWELVLVVLPYDTDSPIERQRIIAEGEQAWAQGGVAHGIWAPEVMRLSVWALEGDWVAVRDALLPIREGTPRFLGTPQFLFSLLAQIAHYQGDAALGWDLVERNLKHGPATAPGDLVFIGGFHFLGVAAALAMDDRDLVAARAWLVAADRWIAWSGSILGRADHLLAWARWHWASGSSETAQTFAKQALAMAAAPRQPMALSRAHRMLGDLAITASEFGDGDEHLGQSYQLAITCGARYERGLSAIALAALRLRTGDVAEAQRLARDAQACLVDLGAVPALQRLESLVSDIAFQVSDSQKLPAKLTAREIEVLRQVADGMTNAQVAEHLFVSRRTIDQHLRSIYNKVGVSSRAAATRYAVEHGLI